MIQDVSSFNSMFNLTAEEYKKFIDWTETLPKVNPGMIGGRYTFHFTPTSIGTFSDVEDCVTKKKLTLSDGGDF